MHHPPAEDDDCSSCEALRERIAYLLGIIHRSRDLLDLAGDQPPHSQP